MTWCPNFTGALRQHCTLMTWYYGAQRNMPAQPTTVFNKTLTNLQHGIRTGVSLSTRTNPPQHYSPCHPRNKIVPSRLVHTLWKVATYLGVTFDKRLIWKPHTQRAEGKTRKKLAIMRKLAGTTWGADEQILKTMYEESVRPVLEYSSTAGSTTAKTN